MPSTTMPPWIFVLICTIGFFGDFDRAITTGAPAQFQYFIQVSHNTTDPGALLGLLSSSYVTTNALSIPLFGYLAMITKPFRVISMGLVVWIVAVAISSVSKSANSFELLVVGRFLSGVGAASFQCTIPAFINDHSPSSVQTLWLGVYMMSACLGAISGGIAASTLSATSWGWNSLYAMEGLAMLPLLCLCRFGIPDEFDRISRDDTNESQALLEESGSAPPKSFFGEVWGVCSNAAFMWLTLGVAAMVFSGSGLAMISTLLLIGVGVFSSETEANVTLGSQSLVTTFVGTFLGGVLLDWTSRGAAYKRQYFAIRQLVLGFPVALGVVLLSVAALPDKTWYLVWNGLSTITFTSMPPVAMTAAFHSVHPSQRSLAVGVKTLVLHVLGDVPAPIIVGYIKDAWAPHCNSVLVDGVVVLNPECHQDKDGLILAMLFPLVWMVWAITCFGIALYFARRTMLKEKRAALCASN
ncbi:hypothetical protein H257_03316 [Aphanomyces astaci]|uniref:Major facilitator superfamily (MFS) profile domain-containing protein n=1 Tax=Aphanomyces astaci TaxID=112090 RepID=W4H0U8_APHAT|nr:hypothetical protein H257_03316 [Aphanomyces astaci]ETV85610.1 hypothetical protein H257_03316 [Aphanomyces astaci]|eukprot:XP_009825628.1 hypothetical protein H257_03316 [Aphanomyces astaci]